MILFREFNDSFLGESVTFWREQGRPLQNGRRIIHATEGVGGRLQDNLESFNHDLEIELREEKFPEEILILHLIADAIACLKDRWVTKQEKVDAFDWIFSPLTEDEGGLKFYADLVGANPTLIQNIATRFLVSDLHFANSLRFWW